MQFFSHSSILEQRIFVRMVLYLLDVQIHVQMEAPQVPRPHAPINVVQVMIAMTL